MAKTCVVDTSCSATASGDLALDSFEVGNSEINLAKLYKECGEIYVTEEILRISLVNIEKFIDVDDLGNYLLKHGLVISIDKLQSITSPNLSHHQQVLNLIAHVSTAGRNGCFLFYVCLFESANKGHQGHKEALENLQKKATEKKVTAPPSICKALEKLKLKAKKETSGYESSGDSDSKDENESGYESNCLPENAAKMKQTTPQSVTLTFRCRSDCSNCTFNHYIQQVECPKNFPWLKVEGEGEDSYESGQLKWLLNEQTKAVSIAFVNLQEDTFQNLSKMAFKDVRRHIKRLVSTGNYNDSILCCSSSTTSCIRETKDYEELEDVLCQNFCSWFNYAIIKEIRKKYLFQDTNLDSALQIYEEKFSHYCRRRCFESPESFHPKPVSTNMKSLVFKIDKDFHECTLDQIPKIRNTVASVINCPEYAVYVKSVKEGCVEVYCYILPQVALSHLNQEQISQLKKSGIFSFKIEGRELMEQDHHTVTKCYEFVDSCDSEGYDASSEGESEEAADSLPNSKEDFSFWVANKYCDKYRDKKWYAIDEYATQLKKEYDASLSRCGKSGISDAIVNEDLLASQYPNKRTSSKRFILSEGSPGVGKTTFACSRKQWHFGCTISTEKVLIFNTPGLFDSCRFTEGEIPIGHCYISVGVGRRNHLEEYSLDHKLIADFLSCVGNKHHDRRCDAADESTTQLEENHIKSPLSSGGSTVFINKCHQAFKYPNEQSFVRKVLIEGTPGTGKSTLLFQMEDCLPLNRTQKVVLRNTDGLCLFVEEESFIVHRCTDTGVIRRNCWKEYSLGNMANFQFNSQPLGSVGSYGVLYTAKCDQLHSAANLVCPTISDPGASKIMERFKQEYECLERIRHPNIVRFIGVTRYPESRLPVLLMELHDESLTKWLKRSHPYDIRLNISRDIALAVAYLHSNDVIHQDLSSNNVLITAGRRAKVTDFGMSKLAGAVPLTMCPGTQAYMFPEALSLPLMNTRTVDPFCFYMVISQAYIPPARLRHVRNLGSRAKMTHFGVSKLAGEAQSMALPTNFVGTQAYYMPPELLPTYTKNAETLDLYSFGRIIVHTQPWPEPGPHTQIIQDTRLNLTWIIEIPVPETHRRQVLKEHSFEEFQHCLCQVCRVELGTVAFTETATKGTWLYKFSTATNTWQKLPDDPIEDAIGINVETVPIGDHMKELISLHSVMSGSEVPVTITPVNTDIIAVVLPRPVTDVTTSAYCSSDSANNALSKVMELSSSPRLIVAACSCPKLCRIPSINSQTGDHLYLLRVISQNEENDSEF